LTNRKTEENPFEPDILTSRSNNLLTVRIDGKKDIKRDKKSAGLPA